MDARVITETISHLSDTGKAIVLSPIRWLLDPLAEQKKGSDWNRFKNLRDHLADLDVIKREESESLFGIQLDTCLGIQVYTKDGGYDFSKIRERDRLVDLALTYPDKIKDRVQTITRKEPVFIDVLEVYGGNVVRGNWVKPLGYEKPLASTAKGNSVHKGVIFPTALEAVNFYEYTNTTLFKYWCIKLKSGYHFHYGKYFPDLRNVNWTDPETGVNYIGYRTQYTDAALYRMFDITDAEVKLIEETIKNYEICYKS